MNNLTNKMTAAGYVMSERLAKIAFAFQNSTGNKNVSAMMIEGIPGSGKTFFAEAFATAVAADVYFYQVNTETSIENLIEDVNISAVIKNNANEVTKDGIVKRAFINSHIKKTVLILDEIDKCSSTVETFLLDALNSGRISTGSEEYYANTENLYVFFTSNGTREISTAMRRRVRKVVLEKMPTSAFLKLLGLEEDHYLGIIYENNQDFVVSQAEMYLQDLGSKDKSVFDLDLLNQYVEVSEDFLEEIKESFETEASAYAIANDIFDSDCVIFKINEDSEEFENVVAAMMSGDISFEEVSIDRGWDGARMKIGTFTGLKKVAKIMPVLSVNEKVDIYFDRKEIEKILITKDNAVAIINGKTVIGEAKNGAFKATLSVEKLSALAGVAITVPSCQDDDEDDEY